MDLEKIATSAIVSSISKTDTLSGFINDGDKEPCWDGNIYIHENSRHFISFLTETVTPSPKGMTLVSSLSLCFSS